MARDLDGHAARKAPACVRREAYASETIRSELRHKTALVVPNGASDALQASIALKNAELTQANTRLDLQWEETLREKNDELGALLQASLKPRAKLRWERLAKAHTLASPYDHMIDGGAIWRDLVALKGTLERESMADRSFNAYVLLRSQPLPTNASTQQFADRFVEFDADVNPHLEAAITGAQYVKLMLSSIPTDLGPDKRAIERELADGGHSADIERARERISILLARAHDPAKPTPIVKRAMEVAMAIVPGKPTPMLGAAALLGAKEVQVTPPQQAGPPGGHTPRNG